MKKALQFIFILLIIFTTSKAKAYDFVVDASGKGDFKTVQEAINAVPDFRKVTTTIFIKKGIYKEKIIVSASKKMVKLIGESQTKTILTFDDFAQKKNRFGEEMGTSGSSSSYVYGDDFTAENITFENSSGPVGQAVAIWVAGDRSQFKNCRFLGFQDTLYTYGNRQFYQNCYVEGTTDFIFGSATAIFKDCDIFCKKGGSFITAASTPELSKFGYVFIDCNVKGEEGASFFLGRPWRPFAKTVFIHCDLGEFIKPQGWDPWGKESNKQTAFYAEYQNKGLGFKPEKRANWTYILNEDQIKSYTLSNILEDWNPK